jgi:hypothetical protein
MEPKSELHSPFKGGLRKIIVVLAGINNVGTVPGGEAKVENITRGLKALVNVCQQKAPGAVIVLTALFPRNDNMAVIPTINSPEEACSRLEKLLIHFDAENCRKIIASQSAFKLP